MMFENELDNESNIAVALSGGGDSMALAYMLCLWAVENNRQIHLLTVNHNLRDDALEEAKMVRKFTTNFPNSIHTILTWNFDDKPDTAVMEKARHARYELMADYCEKNNIHTLCLGHHGDDNFETFLFRLAKGSGLDGLTGMNKWSDYSENLRIYRPLLHCSHDELIQYCKKHNLQWVEDPSNKDERYARPRLRNALKKEGFDTKRFAKTCVRLSRAMDALDWMVLNANNECVNGTKVDFKKLGTYPLDIQVRVLQRAVQITGDVKHNYPPKLERLEDILATLRPSKSATLHGCLLSLSKDGNTLEIKPS